MQCSGVILKSLRQSSSLYLMLDHSAETPSKRLWTQSIAQVARYHASWPQGKHPQTKEVVYGPALLTVHILLCSKQRGISCICNKDSKKANLYILKVFTSGTLFQIYSTIVLAYATMTYKMT